MSAIRHSAKPGFFFKKTLKIFAESQADKALGKDYTLPSANPRTLGKGIFLKKTFLFPFPFPLPVFSKFVPIHFENTLSNSLNNANLMLQRKIDHDFM